MFVPLVHPPGHAQCDFGEAWAVVGGVKRRVHFFVLTAAILCKLSRSCGKRHPARDRLGPRRARGVQSQVSGAYPIYPRQYRPRRRKRQRYFPPWCYVQCTHIGPNTFEGKRMSDDWGIPRPGGKCRRIDRPPIPARQIWEAAKLMDTWAKPSIAQGISTTAEAVKKRLEGGTDAQGGQE